MNTLIAVDELSAQIVTLVRKNSPLESWLATLPDGYEIIHAGQVLAKENFFCRTDATGENISDWN